MRALPLFFLFSFPFLVVLIPLTQTDQSTLSSHLADDLSFDVDPDFLLFSIIPRSSFLSSYDPVRTFLTKSFIFIIVVFLSFSTL